MTSWMKPVVMVVAMLLMAQVALACPSCKDTLAGDPAHSSLARGFYWSILFMMSMPFLILGGLSAYFYYEICKARAHQRNESPGSDRGPASSATTAAGAYVETQ